MCVNLPLFVVMFAVVQFQGQIDIYSEEWQHETLKSINIFSNLLFLPDIYVYIYIRISIYVYIHYEPAKVVEDPAGPVSQEVVSAQNTRTQRLDKTLSSFLI